MSGVLPTDECKATFLKLKEKRAFKFITFAIDEKAGLTNVLDTCETSVRAMPRLTEPPRQIFRVDRARGMLREARTGWCLRSKEPTVF